MMKKFFCSLVLVVFSATATAFITSPYIQQSARFDTACTALTVPGMWGSGLNFGKGKYL
jgi:hypothetical protein